MFRPSTLAAAAGLLRFALRPPRLLAGRLLGGGAVVAALVAGSAGAQTTPGTAGAASGSGSASAPASDRATLPYARLDEIYGKLAGLASRRLVWSVKVVSSNPEVRPGEITFAIVSKTAGTIPLSVGPDGDLGPLRRSPALRRENPPVVSNQPKGSLRLAVQLGLSVPETLSFPYARLADGLTEANRVAREQAGPMPEGIPQARSVEFHFAAAAAGNGSEEGPTLAVAARGGRQVLRADADGSLKLPIDAKLAAENPTVILSARPEWIGVRSD